MVLNKILRFAQRRLKVKDVMTTKVVTVSPEADISKIAKKMEKERIHNVIVVDRRKKPIGIVTGGDIIRKVLAKGLNPKKIKAKDVMSSPLKFVSPEDYAMHAADKMLLNGVKRLPVLDKEGNLVGIVTAKDLLRAIPQYLITKLEWLRIREPEAKPLKKRNVSGICEICGKYDKDLRFSKGFWVCRNCYESEPD